MELYTTCYQTHIQLIAGRPESKGNITNTVYTHLDMSVLLEEVNKLECFI